MNFLWYVWDGKVEEYSGQEVNWSESAVVFARSPEDALLKVLNFYRGQTERVGISWRGRDIEV
ncbi:MAG: hypothetical protein P4L69_07325, partial [Desulfosporosinus sp.]|nr:hypothetical protein [Desulfosporosinus sp.]